MEEQKEFLSCIQVEYIIVRNKLFLKTNPDFRIYGVRDILISTFNDFDDWKAQKFSMRHKIIANLGIFTKITDKY